MIGKPPPRPPGVARKLDLVELRLANLRRELDAETDPTLRAAILYHIGSVYEHELGTVEEAIARYARSEESDPHFRPAAIARMRIAERSGGEADVEALCEARAQLAEPGADATALLDLALRSERWSALMREAIACSAEPVVPALIMEWLAAARDDGVSLREALRAQAIHTSDPALRAAIWLDLALAELDAGEVEAALEALDLASESEALAWSARSLQRRVAREHGQFTAWRSASVAMARILESHPPADPLSLYVPEDERLGLASLLFEEAAAVSANELGDVDAAESYREEALRHFPDDVELRLQSLFAEEPRGDGRARARAWFLDAAPSHPAFVAHELRRALRSPEHDSALEVVREIAETHRDSDYAQAVLEVALVRSQATGEQVTLLRRRAESSEGETRACLLWRAARLARDEDAATLYEEAVEASSRSKLDILRDALGDALVRGDASAVEAWCDQLLAHGLDPDERAVLMFCRYDVRANALMDRPGADEVLREALGDPAHDGWAPHVARVRAALSGDLALLADAHERLARLADAEIAAGHACAAAQAHTRLGRWEDAERVLRDALAWAPTDPHVIDALETVLREGGRPEEVVTLAQTRSDASGARLGVGSLLLAGATAERNGDLAAARDAYRQAKRQAPDSPSAALALLDVARREDDLPLRLSAYESFEEGSIRGGVPELFGLLHADALGWGGAPSMRASASYERALGHEATATAAAVGLLCSARSVVTEDQRTAAEELLADAGALPAEPQDEFDSAFTTLCDALGREAASSGDAWLQLSDLAPTEALRASALLQGLRDLRVSQGEHATDEIFMVAQASADLANRRPEAAIAVEEALTPSEDAELRAAALERSLGYGSELGRAALDAARCRALVEADRGADAVAALTAAIDQRPDDLSLWETLRRAARQSGDWSLVAQACERLAPFVDGTIKADLLEEAGVVRLDHLQQLAQAEDLFRAALDVDPTRDAAFRGLRDLLTTREDAEALDALVAERLALGGPKDRPDLLYERARLLRGFSDRPGALEVLGELFAAEPQHSGALALAAEVHVSLEQWEDAVDCLRRLSRSSIPDQQRRVAHLGAADFLQARLGRREEALVELRAVEALGLADAETWRRIGELEEALGNANAAVEAYLEVLELEPTHDAAVERVAALAQGAVRDRALARYEEETWVRIEDGGLDAPTLEGLRQVAHWRGHLERSLAVGAVEAALAPDAPPEAPTDLSHVSMASIRSGDTSTTIDDVLALTAPASSKSRGRDKKLVVGDPVHLELERLTARYGGRFGSAAATDRASELGASLGRDGEIHWLVPRSMCAGLDGVGRFEAARLAWALPRGADAIVVQSPAKAAGLIAGVLRASQCRVAPGEPILPAVTVKLRRSVRKSVQRAVGDAELSPSELVAAASRIQRTADRVGLLATGDIHAALTTLCEGPPSLHALRSSRRAVDLLRFWMAAESPLWRADV